MKRRELIILTGVIATLGLAQPSIADAKRLGLNLGGSAGAHVSLGGGGVNVNVGGKGGVDVHGDVGGGNHPDTSVSVDVGAGGDGPVNRANVDARANVDLGGTRNTATAKVQVGSPTTAVPAVAADVDLDLGGQGKTAHATVDLNGDGVINGKDDVLVALDINADGVLDVLDDVNGDGVLSSVDLGDVGIGIPVTGTIRLPDVGVTIDTGDVDGRVSTRTPGNGTTSRPRDTRDTTDRGPSSDDGDTTTVITRRNTEMVMGSLDNHDVIALKLKCADVLSNPGSSDATTLAVCQVLAAR